MAHTLRLPFRVGEDVVAGIGVDTIARDFRDDVSTTRLSIAQTFKGINRATFRNDNTVAVFIEGSARFVRVCVFRKRTLAFEARKNSKGLNTLAHTPCERKINFVQAQHLHRLNQTCIPRRTRGSNRVMRTRDAGIDCNFTRRIIRDCAWIVVVRPVTHIVIKL